MVKTFNPNPAYSPAADASSSTPPHSAREIAIAPPASASIGEITAKSRS
ncbi:hypothetical protein PhaeoP11_01293 [Phaeobacter gallaeciensis]|nr:hypothetical protein PhaeoP11_01293 [Phaeobacter gallaeciensis]